MGFPFCSRAHFHFIKYNKIIINILLGWGIGELVGFLGSLCIRRVYYLGAFCSFLINILLFTD